MDTEPNKTPHLTAAQPASTGMPKIPLKNVKCQANSIGRKCSEVGPSTNAEMFIAETLNVRNDRYI